MAEGQVNTTGVGGLDLAEPELGRDVDVGVPSKAAGAASFQFGIALGSPRTPLSPDAARGPHPRADGSLWPLPVLSVLWAFLAGSAFLSGLDYYVTPVAERGLHPDHLQLAPTGSVGYVFGTIGLAMIVLGLGSFSIRRRVGGLREIGTASGWLRSGVFLSTLGSFGVMLHTGFRFGGLASVSVWSMLIVGLSALVGGYLYSWLPKTTDGLLETLPALEGRRQSIVQGLWTMTDVPPDRIESLITGDSIRQAPGLVSAFRISVRYRLGWQMRRKRLAAALSIAEVPFRILPEALELVAEQHRIETQMALQSAFQALFRAWKAVHIPLSFVTLALIVTHIAAITAIRYAWAF